MSATAQDDWTKPAAMAIPKAGYFEEVRGRYGPVFPKTPTNYGVTIIAKVKAGHEDAIRAVGPQIEAAVAAHPGALAPLQLHYLRTILFDVGSGLHFQYQAIFDTELDKYLEDALAFFTGTGTETAFAHLEGWPDDWQTNLPALIEWMRPQLPQLS